MLTFADIGLSLTEKGLEAAVEKLLGIEREQVALLKRIEGKLTILQSGPYRSGKAYLESALQPGMDQTRARREIDKARDEFIRAYNQLTDDPTTQSSVAILAAGTAVVLGYPIAEAQTWLKRAYDQAAFATQQRADKLKRQLTMREVPFGVFDSEILIKSGITEQFAGPLFKKFTKKVVRKAEPDLKQLDAYVRSIGDMRRQLGVPDSEIPAYSFLDDHGEEWWGEEWWYCLKYGRPHPAHPEIKSIRVIPAGDGREVNSLDRREVDDDELKRWLGFEKRLEP